MDKMDKCYNFTINATNKYINYCLNKCIENDDDEYDDYYNKGTLSNNGALAKDCYCNCISNYDGYQVSETFDNESFANVFLIIFFAIIVIFFGLCLYKFVKIKFEINTINRGRIANTDNINTVPIIEQQSINVNYYTLNNPNQDISKDLPKYNDLEPNFTLPPKYDSNSSNSSNSNNKSNYSNELM